MGKVAKEVSVYLPDHATWENLKESVSALMPAPKAEVEDNIMEQMNKIKPSMKLKLKNKGLKKKWAKKKKKEERKKKKKKKKEEEERRRRKKKKEEERRRK